MTPPRVPVPEGTTPEGAAGLAAIVADPGHALIALDFDGTLAPIVSEPSAARPHPDVLPALERLATGVGTLAIITGRPAPAAVELGGFAGIPGLIVIGHHGFERWEGGQLTSPPPRPRSPRPVPGCPAHSPRPAPPRAPGSRTRAMRSWCTSAGPPTRRPRWRA